MKQAAFAIGKQAGVSIAILDPEVLSRRAPAIRRQSNADRALLQLANSTGLKLLRLGAASYALMPAPRKAKVWRAEAHPTTPIAAHVDSAPLEQPEIVVVASKRDTLSSRFSGAWSRIDGADFGNLGVQGAGAIEARTVSFSSTHLGSGRNKLFIRGIADSSFSGPTQSPVGEYFDDVRTGYSGADPDLKLVDIDSVEVLEGPQGTLYGSGALGGIVLIRPNKPVFGDASASIAGGASLTWQGAGSRDISGVVNLPLGSGAALRGVAYNSYEGGYIDNVATGARDVNGVSVTGGRGALSVKLGNDWLLDAGAAAQRIAGNDSQYADLDESEWARSSLVKQPFDSSFRLGTVAVRKDSGTVRFRSTSAIARQNVDETFDATIGNRARELHQHSRGHSFSNETRLWRPMDNGYSWLAGFSSIWNNYLVTRDLRQGATQIDLAGAENRIHETTLFGEVAVRLSPRVDATVGARYTIARLSGSGQHLSAVSTEPVARRTERSLLPSASLLFRPTERLTLYGRFQQGFRPGGLSIIDDSVSLFNSDHLKTGELGLRWGQRGRDRFDLQASATYSRWHDIQADFLDDRGLPSTSNIGDGRVITFTANAGARLSDQLRLEAGIAWNNGKITRPDPQFLAAATIQGGSMEIPNIARVVARGAVDWRGQLNDRWAFRANAYARYVGHSRLGIGPRLGEVQGEYFDSGASLRLDRGTNAWSLTITNILNLQGNRFAFGALGFDKDQITPLRPRTIRLGFEERF